MGDDTNNGTDDRGCPKREEDGAIETRILLLIILWLLVVTIGSLVIGESIVPSSGADLQ